MRNYVQFVIEGKQQSPWRLHWPADRGDDQLFSDFVTISSMRFNTWGTVNAAMMHVREFHLSMLSLSPPELPEGFY